MDWVRVTAIINPIASIVTIIAIVIGGVWTYFRFIRQVEYFPHIEFEVDIRFVGLHKDEWLVELQALINNKGVVRHEMRDLGFELRYLKKSDDLQDGDESINCQTLIPHVLKEGYWIGSGLWWQDPGVNAQYRYVTHIPKDAVFLLLHGNFFFKDGKGYRADKLIKVPKQDIELHESLLDERK